MQTLRPWQLSFMIHVGFVSVMVMLTVFKLPHDEFYQVPIEIAAPQDIQNLTEVKDQPKVVLKSINELVPSSKPVREVFGASRESYTDSAVQGDGVEAKKGNTLAKEADATQLLDSDATSLPTPTEEYLVSEMPQVLTEIRPLYPIEAKAKQLEGSVVMDILIDEQGVVRQVSVIEGAEIFRPGATEAMKKFKFKPAKVEGKPVAVRIRYTLNFKLEF